MQLVNAKCTSCGAKVEVNKLNDTATCKFCGSEFLVGQAIQSYYVSNSITAQNVSINGDVYFSEGENHLLEKAEQFMAFGDYNSAKKAFYQVTNDFPKNVMGLLGLLRIQTQEYTRTYDNSYASYKEDDLINRIKILSGANTPHLAKYNQILGSVKKYDENRLNFIKNNPITESDLYGDPKACPYFRTKTYFGFIDQNLYNQVWNEGKEIAQMVCRHYGVDQLRALKYYRFLGKTRVGENHEVQAFLRRITDIETYSKIYMMISKNRSPSYSPYVIYINHRNIVVYEGSTESFSLYPTTESITKATLQNYL